MFSRLQYISQGKNAFEQEENIKRALDQGADWVQIRWKNPEEKDSIILSEKVNKLCKRYHAVCIINDSVSIAKLVDADGVHLGLDDSKIEQARATLGQNKIIGGTANTLDDIIQRYQEGCDYIGLGPLRYTPTKEKLSPTLGTDGYQYIINALHQKKIPFPPIFAIGGITLSDVETLRNIGIYGIALSGLITQYPTLIQTIKKNLQ